jgi:hypothetical protein
MSQPGSGYDSCHVAATAAAEWPEAAGELLTTQLMKSTPQQDTDASSGVQLLTRGARSVCTLSISGGVFNSPAKRLRGQVLNSYSS